MLKENESLELRGTLGHFESVGTLETCWGDRGSLRVVLKVTLKGIGQAGGNQRGR